MVWSVMSARILVVDDDKEIVRLLKSYFLQEGLTVFTALDGAEALHLVRRERPDLVVLDLTPTELPLRRTLLDSPNQAFTRSELIEKALAYDHEALERTLDTHIKNLRRKIESDPAQPQYIETVFGVGYRMRGEGDTL